MKSAVIYYSRTGKTRYVSKKIEDKLSADDIEIKDTTNSGFMAYINCALRTIENRITNIEPKHIDITGYDTIYIGSPVWGANIAPAIFEIIMRTDFTGKDVVTFTTFKSDGATKSLDILNKLVRSRGGRVIKSFAISSETNGKLERFTKKALANL